MESFWSLLKRGVIGTYHNVSKEYLPLHLNEFSYRHNNPDIFDDIIAGCSSVRPGVRFCSIPEGRVNYAFG